MHNLHTVAKLHTGAKLHPGVNLHPLMNRSYVIELCSLFVMDLLFKHITNVSVLLFREFDVLRMFKIPSCEKKATSIGLICFD